jgi:hypothetical protein
MATVTETKSGDKAAVGDGSATPQDRLHSPVNEPTFLLPQNGDWEIVLGKDGMFAVRDTRISYKTAGGKLKTTSALIVLAPHEYPIRFPARNMFAGPDETSLAVHDGVEGTFDTTIAPLHRRKGVVTIGDYQLSYQKAVSPEGKFLLVKVEAPTAFGAITVPSKGTPAEKILAELTRQSQAKDSK